MLLDTLNAEQQACVLYRGGPLLIAAGPGTGKTRTITTRIAYGVVERGIEPRQILAITFTNAAATEMKLRLETLLGGAGTACVGTFHWMCQGLLRRHADVIGIRRDFDVLSPARARECMRQALISTRLSEAVSVAQAAGALAAMKNGVSRKEAARMVLSDEATFARLERAYTAVLRAANAVDLDDLLYLAVSVLRESDAVQSRCRRAFQEIVVDEYQDTNPTQRDILRLLLPESRSLVAVGDDDQSIYSWRQSDVSAFLEFGHDFPGAHVLELTTNYRSTKCILRAAEGLIRHNSRRLPKHLSTVHGAGDRPLCFAAGDEVEEAEFVAGEVERLARAERVGWRDVAVVYRTNAQSRVIEDACIRRRIPYRVYAGRRFYDRDEIRWVAAYLRLVVDPRHAGAALELCALVPGIGPGRLARIREVLETSVEPVAQVLRRGIDAIPGNQSAGLAELAGRIDAVYSLRDRGLVEVVDGAIDQLRHDFARIAGDEVRDTVAELRSIAVDVHRQRGTVRTLLDHLALSGEGAAAGDAVTLLSAHASKGTEFDTVFVVGLEEGVLPHRRTLERPQDLEEERRLFYVAVTRARKRLYLSYAHFHLLGGQAQVGGASRFLGEIGLNHLAQVPSPHARRRPRLISVQPGEHVVHPRWQRGTVVTVEGAGKNTFVTIDFGIGGLKRLQLCHAPLSRTHAHG